MGFKTGAYAKVWKVEKGKGNFYVANLSTSKKNADGTYETDWANGFVTLVGSAAKKAEGGLPDRVRIGECEVKNKYSKEKNTTYTNYLIYSFQEEEDKNKPKSPQRTDNPDFVKVPDASEEELPFE